MGKNNYYLVCRRRWFGKLSPVKIFTALNTARDFCTQNKRYVVLKQKAGGEFELVTNKDN